MVEAHLYASDHLLHPLCRRLCCSIYPQLSDLGICRQFCRKRNCPADPLPAPARLSGCPDCFPVQSVWDFSMSGSFWTPDLPSHAYGIWPKRGNNRPGPEPELFHKGNLWDFRFYDFGGNASGTGAYEWCQETQGNHSWKTERKSRLSPEGYPHEPEYCRLRCQRFHEKPGLCTQHDLPVCCPRGKPHHHRSKIGIVRKYSHLPWECRIYREIL